MEQKRITTALIPAVGAAAEQSSENMYAESIADPGYLPTISMAQLYEEIYQARPRLIENLLYPGTYLFVGAPKLGKRGLETPYGITHFEQYGRARYRSIHFEHSGSIKTERIIYEPYKKQTVSPETVRS